MTPHETVEIFGPIWWKWNIITFTTVAIVLYAGHKAQPHQKEFFAKIIGVVAIARWVLIHPIGIYMDNWNIQSNLPLQMCGFSSILGGVVLFWRKQIIYEFVFFMGISSAIHAFWTPEFTMGTRGYFFYDYYINHGCILLVPLYMTLILGYKPRVGGWWKAFLFAQVLLPPVAIANWLLDANYMYMCQKPIADNPFVIGEWPYYFLIIEAVGLMHYFLLYVPFGLKYYWNKEPIKSLV